MRSIFLIGVWACAVAMSLPAGAQPAGDVEQARKDLQAAIANPAAGSNPIAWRLPHSGRAFVRGPVDVRQDDHGWSDLASLVCGEVVLLPGLECRNVRTGELVWRSDGDPPTRACALHVIGDRVLLAREGALEALSLATGAKLFAIDLPVPPATRGPHLRVEPVLLASGDEDIAVFHVGVTEASRGRGSRGRGSRGRGKGTAIGTVLGAVDLRAGEILWQESARAYFASAPALRSRFRFDPEPAGEPPSTLIARPFTRGGWVLALDERGRLSRWRVATGERDRLELAPPEVELLPRDASDTRLWAGDALFRGGGTSYWLDPGVALAEPAPAAASLPALGRGTRLCGRGMRWGDGQRLWGDALVFDSSSGELRELSLEPEDFPSLDPAGQRILLVAGDDLYLWHERDAQLSCWSLGTGRVRFVTQLEPRADEATVQITADGALLLTVVGGDEIVALRTRALANTDEGLPLALRELGALELASGEPRAAAAAFRQHVELLPADWRGMLGLGEALAVAGDFEGLGWLERTLERGARAPDDARARAEALLRDTYGLLDRQRGSVVEFVFDDEPLDSLAPERLFRDLNQSLQSVRPDAVDRTRQLRPVFLVDHARRLALPLSGSDLLVHDQREGRLVCLAPDGRSRWARTLSSSWASGGSGGKITQIVVAAQHEDWLLAAIAGTSHAGARVELVAVDRATGDERWSDDLAEPAAPRSYGQLWVCGAGAGNVAVVLDGSSEMRIYDAAKGDRRAIAVRGPLRDLWGATGSVLLVRNEQPGSIGSETTLIDLATGAATQVELAGTSRPILLEQGGSVLALLLHTEGRLAVHDLARPEPALGEVRLPWPSTSRQSPAPALLHLLGDRLVVCPAAQDGRRFLFDWGVLWKWMRVGEVGAAPAGAAGAGSTTAEAPVATAGEEPAPVPAPTPESAPGAESAMSDPGELTCVLLRMPGFDERQSAKIDEVERWLGEMPDLRVLGRERTATVLGDRAGGIGFAPDPAPAREIGELLQARLLVLLSPAARGATVGFVETELGVRLGEGALSLEGSAPAIAVELGERIDRALVDRLGGIERVFSVVPLVCLDPEGSAREQGRELSRLVGETLAAQPGTAVVALGSAGRISQERWLAAEDPSLRRPLPFFLLGTFRNHREGGAHTIDVSLRVRQRDAVLRSEELSEVPAAELPARLAEAVARIALGAAGRGGFADGSDDDLEAALLSELAAEHGRRREWADALRALHGIELLDPGDPARSQQLARTAGKLADAHQASDSDSHASTECADVLDLLTQTLQTLESREGEPANPAMLLQALTWRHLGCAPVAPDAYRQVMALLLSVTTELMGDPRIPAAELVAPARRLLHGFASLGDRAWLEALQAIVLRLDERGDAFREQCVVGCGTHQVQRTSRELRAFLDRLRSKSSRRLRDLVRVHELAWSATDADPEERAAELAAIAGEHGAYDAGWWRGVGAPLERFAPPRPPRLQKRAEAEHLPDRFTTEDGALEIRRVELHPAEGITLREERHSGEWMDGGEDFDLLLYRDIVYRVDPDLALTPLLEVPERTKDEIFASAAWDGGHVWAALAGDGGGVRIVGRDGGAIVARLDLEGLQQGSHRTQLVAIAEDEVLLVTESNRASRILRLTLEGASVRRETVHEVLVEAEPLGGIAAAAPRVFMPTRVALARSPDRSVAELLIAYGSWSPYRVLAVDLADPRPRLLDYPGEDSSLVGWDEERFYLTRKVYDSHRMEHRLLLMSAPIAGGEPTLMVDLGRGEHGDGPTTRHGRDGMLAGHVLWFPIEIGERDQKGTPLEPHLARVDLSLDSEPTLEAAQAAGRVRLTALPEGLREATLHHSRIHGLLLRDRKDTWRVEDADR